MATTQTPSFYDASITRKGINAIDDVEALATIQNLTEEGKVWRSSLTENELDAVLHYQMSAYDFVNAHLRGYGEEYDKEYAEPLVKLLDEALARVGKKSVERVLYRSITVPRSLRKEGSSKQEVLKSWVDSIFTEGEIVAFPEYLSTTIDSDLVIRTNERSSRQGYHAVLEIISADGASLHVEPRTGSWGVQDDEKEILLPRGKSFRVVAIYDDVTFESTYPYGTDNSNKGIHKNLVTSNERYQATVPVIQLVEV